MEECECRGLPVARAVLVVFSCFLLLYGAEAQQRGESAEPNVFNTSSCIEPPYRCPHRRIQFYLYTRYVLSLLKPPTDFFSVFGRKIKRGPWPCFRATQEDPQLLNTLDAASLHQSRFDPQHQTKIIIHGFGGGRHLSPSTDLRDAYFTRGEYNIIIVDYSTLVKEPCLSQVNWAPRFGAKCIAQLVEYLAAHPRGVAPDVLHLIGYSVGAHIAGLVANYLNAGKLGRITGLDPTILFYMGNNRSRDLDPTDAHFIDVIHTGAGILGQWGPNGHADFYVNGGTSQPGCAQNSIFSKELL
ncbi:hypothetical protein C0J52_04198 [Blattella germanica]|nr:hypothetical protein C0J52_04198 [Blattella germanica]